MDTKDKVLKQFQKILESSKISNNVIFEFLRELYHFVYEDIFIIGEKDDFTIKKVEGMTFFDILSRTLYLSVDSAENKTLLFNTLISMMQYYHHVGNHPDEKDTFKSNAEHKISHEYVAAAITKFFLEDIVYPEPNLEAVMREYGLFDDILLIRMFSKHYLPQIEYEGDLALMLEKIQDTIQIYNEINDETPEDGEMMEAVTEYAGKNIEEERPSDSDKEGLLRSLLEGISIR